MYLVNDSFCLPNNGWRTISAHGTVIAIICYIYLLCTPTHTHISITPIASRGECKKSRKKKSKQQQPLSLRQPFSSIVFSPFSLLLLHRCSAIFFSLNIRYALRLRASKLSTKQSPSYLCIVHRQIRWHLEPRWSTLISLSLCRPGAWNTVHRIPGRNDTSTHTQPCNRLV